MGRLNARGAQCKLWIGSFSNCKCIHQPGTGACGHGLGRPQAGSQGRVGRGVAGGPGTGGEPVPLPSSACSTTLLFSGSTFWSGWAWPCVCHLGRHGPAGSPASISTTAPLNAPPTPPRPPRPALPPRRCSTAGCVRTAGWTWPPSTSWSRWVMHHAQHAACTTRSMQSVSVPVHGSLELASSPLLASRPTLPSLTQAC